MTSVNNDAALRSAIQSAGNLDVITLTGSSPFFVTTLAKVTSVPGSVQASGYTIEGNGQVLSNTRIYQENMDGTYRPYKIRGVINPLKLQYTANSPVDGSPLLRATSGSYVLDQLLITGVHRGWDGNGGLYLSLTSPSGTSPINANFKLENSTINIAGQGNGFQPGNSTASGGSAFLHSWNNVGSVELINNQFDEAGFLSSFNFLTSADSSPLGSYTISGNTFFRSSNQTVRSRGNRLENVTATLSNNTFSDGSFLDLFGNASSITLQGNTFYTVAGGFAIRLQASTQAFAPPVLTGLNTFTGPGLPIKYTNPNNNQFQTLSGNITINGVSGFATITAAGQGDDAMTLTNGKDWAIGDDGNDLISALAGDDVVIGGNGNDTFSGGLGNDILTGGAGNDQFRWFSGDGTDVITDFTPGNDLIGLANIFTNTITGNILNAGDFLTRATLSALVATDDNKVVRITSAQNNNLVTGATQNNLSNAYVLVFNSNLGYGQLFFDEDWGNLNGRQLVANLTNITSIGQFNAISNNQFIAV